MGNKILRFIISLWKRWNVRGFVLVSLSLQTILILVAPFRKRSGSTVVIGLVWSSYLLADWAADFAVGQISNSKRDDINEASENEYLLAFWAPFLLLHLGGPDTISAFSLEDNALWLRHLVGLIFQLSATMYVFILTMPKNNLWLPTLAMFVAGVIKYYERTRALYLACLDNFKKSMLKKADPGPNYAKFMREYSSMKETKLPTRIELIPEPSLESRPSVQVVKEGPLKDEIEAVQLAYHFFEIFKGLIVDLIFSFRERYMSRQFFHERTPEEAFKLIAIELNFMYEVLYTKVNVVHSVHGYVLRGLEFSALFVAFLLFILKDKHDLQPSDIGITYTLILGGIALDAVALLMLIFSDMTVALFQKCLRIPCLATIFNSYLSLKKPKWAHLQHPMPWWRNYESIVHVIFRRWSESIFTFNLIDYCLKQWSRDTHFVIIGCWDHAITRITDYFGLKDLVDWIKYAKSKRLAQGLWDFIFEELRKKSLKADDPQEALKICSALCDEHNSIFEEVDDHKTVLIKSYLVGVDYDQSLLIWHIATQLCYDTDHNDKNDNHHNPSPEPQQDHDPMSLVYEQREYSKTLSDYMLYLLIMQPGMMSTVGGIGKIRFRDTCEEAFQFLEDQNTLVAGVGNKRNYGGSLSEEILKVNTPVKPGELKGDQSKSVLFDACILAKELKTLGRKEMWSLTSKIWVQMLSYAASHCSPPTHAQQLSGGGELLSFVWLLMSHFGIGQQFRFTGGHARAKLIVGK